MNFGQAIEALKVGKKVARSGWNGKGIYIELQRPDEHSKMTSPYIYIDTTGLITENPDAPKSRVPWLASQTDMLAEDWVTWLDPASLEPVLEITFDFHGSRETMRYHKYQDPKEFTNLLQRMALVKITQLTRGT